MPLIGSKWLRRFVATRIARRLTIPVVMHAGLSLAVVIRIVTVIPGDAAIALVVHAGPAVTAVSGEVAVMSSDTAVPFMVHVSFAVALILRGVTMVANNATVALMVRMAAFAVAVVLHRRRSHAGRGVVVFVCTWRVARHRVPDRSDWPSVPARGSGTCRRPSPSRSASAKPSPDWPASRPSRNPDHRRHPCWPPRTRTPGHPAGRPSPKPRRCREPRGIAHGNREGHRRADSGGAALLTTFVSDRSMPTATGVSVTAASSSS